MPANSWDFQHYFRWHSRKNKKKFNAIIGSYKNSLYKILNSNILHDDIKAYVGGLLKNMNTSKAEKTVKNITTNNFINSAVNYGEGGANIVVGQSSMALPISSESHHAIQEEGDKANYRISPLKRKHSKCNTELPWKRLLNLAYDLYSGKDVSPNSYELYHVEASSLQAAIFNVSLDKLNTFKHLNRLDLSYLAVFLSGIVNTIDVHNWALLSSYCSDLAIEKAVSDSQVNYFHKYSDKSLEQLMLDIKKLYADEGFEAVRIFILEKKLEAYKSKEATKNSSVLILLDMLDHIINMVSYSSWKDETEMGYLEYWKPLFKTLFRDCNLIIKSGETSCIASKIDRQLNEYEYKTTIKGITGRKVDLIFCTAIDNEVYELFNAEFKTASASQQIIRIQQNKNLRLNKSILSKLICDTGNHSISTFGVDVVGLVGYMYHLSCFEDVIVAAKSSEDDIYLPRDKSELEDFISTDLLFPALFNLKNHIKEMVQDLTTQVRKQYRSRQNISNSRVSLPVSTVSIPPTFFTPKR
ncbi:uncharacterized protein RHIMIDRAFT_265501 [Rhizopus microsporus ATCC 52813]|uniref:Uncharacterized protein n=1 Tax=Rhizopus microsporus ATCC 52813 TaxID=1340429 RepID=A0A2G4T6B2_RHIZD|nr:uncharacterized protein RHIMIDRAFT_265501 [Rhizopus microsporus ATCC 52813]PHZ16226.1 hypothetical protein RHIMIDRAFT_265501 [Rhizopus microsporus ATCC 52813]